MVKLKDIILRWAMKLRTWWQPNYWVWTAVLLWPMALFLPLLLIKIGHHPPVGAYVAIMGVLAAAVTFRKDPPPTEKAAWILLITLVMSAEIQNLYISDEEQAGKFETIRDGLRDTKKGLDATVVGLNAAASSLQGISGDIKTAADNMTGGSSYVYLDFQRPIFALQKKVGEPPLPNVNIEIKRLVPNDASNITFFADLGRSDDTLGMFPRGTIGPTGIFSPLQKQLHS